LLKIAHNACRMRWVRNSRRPQEVPLDGKVEQIVVAEQERPNLRVVLDELAKLPFNQRSALVMRELEGRSYEEIAETLDVTVPAVETLLVRARRAMRSKRSAINALGAVQLPASLESFFGSGAVATGGALAAGGVVFKAAAVLVAGLVAGGAGYTAVGATKRLKTDPRTPHQIVRASVQPGARGLSLAVDAKPQAPARAKVHSQQPHVVAQAPKQSAPPATIGIGAQPAAAPDESPSLKPPAAPLAPSAPLAPAAPPASTVPAEAPASIPQPAVPAPTLPQPVAPPVQPPPLPQVPATPAVPSLPPIPHVP
jgi:hypothetical protein